MQTDNLFEILQCPDCGGKISSGLQCTLCKKSFETRNEIIKFLPTHDLPLLSIYDDFNYKKYHEILVESHDYFYDNPNPIIRWIHRSLYPFIVSNIQKKEGLVLETGCGTGKLLKYSTSIDLKRYVALDIDLSSLERFENKSRLKAVIQSTAYKLPFCPHVFDTIISCAQLEHLCYLDCALQEVARVLKPHGEFIASVPTEGGLLWTLGRRLTSARHFGKKLGIDYIKANRIDHFNTIHQIDRALRRHFRIKRRHMIPFRFPSFDLNVLCTYVMNPL